MNHVNSLLCLMVLPVLIGCTKKPPILANGLTKSAFDITELGIAVNIDKLGIETKDTILYTKRRYDNKDNVIEQIDSSTVQNFRMILNWEYDKHGLIRSLKTWRSVESSTIETSYNYIDTVLQSITLYDETEDFIMSSSTHLTYYSNGTQKAKTTDYSVIEKERQDTSIESKIDFFAEDGFNYKSSDLYFDDPSKNRTYNYNKKNHMITEIKEYDSKDSLISVIDLEYELDSLQNWTSVKYYENNNLVRISQRTINYR